MADYRDHHATIFVAPEVAGPIEAARRDWDPDMAARIAAHVTLVYPQEAPITDLLVERLREASNNIRPFRLRLGSLACFERPEGGVYVNVEDIDGGYRKMREEVLRPPFHGITYPPHVTLVHPQTSRRGREFWDSGRYKRQVSFAKTPSGGQVVDLSALIRKQFQLDDHPPAPPASSPPLPCVQPRPAHAASMRPRHAARAARTTVRRRRA